jgi:ABC-type branched-subunit amino acid transport system substrate-binding protein
MEETIAFKPLAEKDQLPYITLAISEKAIYPPGWLYSTYPTDAERFAVWCDFIMENWQNERPPWVAFIGPDSEYGRDPEVQGTKYAESIGIEMLPMEFVPYVPLDFTTQLLRVSERGADFVYITSVWSTALPVRKDAQRLGLMGQITFGG